MAVVTMKFEGGKELAAALAQLPEKVSQRVLLAALKDAAEPMRSRMSQLAPREPGAPDIADNIGVSAAGRIGSTGGGRWVPTEASEVAVAVGPTKDFFYGIFLEYGTVHMHQRPFMRPAFDSEAPKALKILADELWTALAEKGIGQSVTATDLPIQAPSGGGGLL